MAVLCRAMSIRHPMIGMCETWKDPQPVKRVNNKLANSSFFVIFTVPCFRVFLFRDLD